MNTVGVIIDIVIVMALAGLILWNASKIAQAIKKRKEKKRLNSRMNETIEERKEDNERH